MTSMQAQRIVGVSASAMLLAAVGGCTASRMPESDAGGVDAPVIIEFDVRPIDTGPPDTGVVCDPGLVNCNGTCTRVAADSDNCGSCGNVCPAGTTCAIGRCDCTEPRTSCDGLCTDTTSDPANCGMCGMACDPTQMCSMGECIVMCTAADHRVCVNRDAAGEPVQVCADLMNDPLNCGVCNTQCAAGSTCTMGRCVCPGTQVSCAGGCTDTAIDPMNCGGCLSSCGEGGTCAAGRCSACGTGLMLCGTAGRCFDTSTSRLHCGMCGRACRAGEDCVGGTCECIEGFLDCGGSGCTNPMTDPANCGGCGINCGPGGVCTAGSCACATGLTLCSGSCVNTMTSMPHCGGCGMPCTLVGGVCAGGSCGCPAGMSDCSGTCRNTSTSLTDCGGCGMPCTLGGGVCAAGVCGCPSGQTDCGGTCRNTQSDVNNCGMCGMICPPGNVCLSGGCTDAPPTRYRLDAPAPAGVVFIDACAAPGRTTHLAAVDDDSVRVALPFATRFWATDLPMGSMVKITSNGWIGMNGVASADRFPAAFPTAASPNAMIAAHWGDNVMRTPGICVATVGMAPNRQWVVEWSDAQYFLDATPHLTFEIIITEGSNTIDLVYGTMMGARAQGMGIENQTGTMGLSACPGGATTCIPATGSTFRFTPIP